MKKILILIVLCVSLFADFTRTNQVVSDDSTSLKWSDHEVLTKTWMEAITYCETLSLDSSLNWRLPNIQELLSIVGGKEVLDTSYPNSLNKIFVNSNISDEYWSSTTYSSSKNSAYVISARYGTTKISEKNNSKKVRCVK